MTRPDFDLNSPLVGPLRPGPAAAAYRLDLCGLGCIAAKGQAVLAGQKVAVSEAGWTGDLHSPVAGTVTAVGGEFLTIAPDPRDPARRAQAVSLADAPPGLLLTALSGLGIDIRGLGPASTLVINAVNPEPGVSAFTRIMAEFPDEMDAGLELALSMIAPKRTMLTAAQGQSVPPGLAGLDVCRVPAAYPAGLDPLAAAAATGRENDPDTAVISVNRLLNLGRAALQGAPVTETVLTVAGTDWLVRIGTPASALLALSGLEPGPGDRLVLGGPMQGQAQYDTDAPVAKRTYALCLVRQGLFPPVTTKACLNCGECVRRCPARIQVNMMTRCAEFGLFDKALAYDLDSCFECGLCAFWCPARRPLLQYIRLAKAELLAAGRFEPEGLFPGLRRPGNHAPARSGDKGAAA